MKQVAKLLMIDPDDKYLLMYRTDHPTYGVDPDLPGGTMENGETFLETMLREVLEESGVVIDGSQVTEVYSGIEYSEHGTSYALFVTHLKSRPDIKMSWEHSSYEWLDRADFLDRAKGAKDTYMHMVCERLT